MKYTEADVISWPGDKRIDPTIETNVYAGSHPCDLLNMANADVESSVVTLEGVRFSSAGNGDNDNAFECSDGYSYPFVIIRKPKRYVPYDLSDKCDTWFLKGRWLMNKDGTWEGMITSFVKCADGEWRASLESEDKLITGKELMERYIFPGINRPVGKEAKE